MRVGLFNSARAMRALALVLGSMLFGCGGGSLFLDGGPPRTTLNLTTLGVGDVTTHLESVNNNLLRDAELVDIGSDARVVRGSITGSRDVDVFDFGFMARGTRLVVNMTTEATLNGALAVFDGNGASLLVNDHRNAYLGRKDAFIDVVARRDMEHCFVAVSATPRFSADGDYAFEASKTEQTPIPSARPEEVLLVFSGGSNVIIGGRAPVDVPVFEAAQMDPRFSRNTPGIVARVVELVREDYAEHDVTIYSTSEGAEFDGQMTRLYFGTYDPGLLGVAEGVDEFNGTSGQNAIVFTDTFSAFEPLVPTVEEMSTALANVASHEIGHLLGLIHTQDVKGIMDVTASLNQLMVDQSFRMSPLYSDVFPIGHQNAGQSLLDAVGGVFDLSPFLGVGLPKVRAKTISPPDGPSAREMLLLSTCGLHEH